jgi:hypothetical protein
VSTADSWALLGMQARDVAGDGRAPDPSAAEPDSDDGGGGGGLLTREEFAKVQREVEMLGG